MKVTVEKITYETVDIDDKFAPVIEKIIQETVGNTTIWTDEEEVLWDELIELAEKNEWHAGYTTDKYKDICWEL